MDQTFLELLSELEDLISAKECRHTTHSGKYFLGSILQSCRSPDLAETLWIARNAFAS